MNWEKKIMKFFGFKKGSFTFFLSGNNVSVRHNNYAYPYMVSKYKLSKVK